METKIGLFDWNLQVYLPVDNAEKDIKKRCRIPAFPRGDQKDPAALLQKRDYQKS